MLPDLLEGRHFKDCLALIQFHVQHWRYLCQICHSVRNKFQFDSLAVTHLLLLDFYLLPFSLQAGVAAC